MIKTIIIILSLFILSCDSSETKKDCRAIKDYYNPDITHFECPDGTNYSSAMAAGIVDGDVVDLQTQVDIVNVK
jgi:hypothetical protein